MSHKQCCACGKQLDNCRERRKLHSSSTKHVLPVLLQALSAHLENLSEDAITRLLPHDSVICRTPCFSSLESLLRLEDEARKVREKIDSRLSQLYTASSSASSSVDVPTAKRLRFDRQDTPSRPKPSGRQHLFGEKLNPATSPVATVSSLYKGTITNVCIIFISFALSFVFIGGCQFQKAEVFPPDTIPE